MYLILFGPPVYKFEYFFINLLTKKEREERVRAYSTKLFY
jgi:hypothetical protein